MSSNNTVSYQCQEQCDQHLTSIVAGGLADRDVCCQGFRRHLPSYRWRWFGSKGMVVVLLWSFAAFTLLNYVLLVHVESNSTRQLRYLGVICVGSMLLPVSGWVADTYIGRYRIIKCSLIVMWAGAILLCLANIVLVIRRDFYVPMLWPATVIPCVAVGIFLVNILKFSIDQLFDASSEQIISFITWYAWTYFSSKSAVQLLICLEKKSDAFPVLYIAILFTVAVTCDALCHHWLTKEPVTPNPLKLILKVLHYAATNKYPRNRSAFWSWDTKQSRIDLAKMKYGGPFTAREVEDVKTFFQILGLGIIFCLFVGMALFFGGENFILFSKFSTQYSVYCARKSPAPTQCLKIESISHAGYLLVTFCIPLFEVCVRPFLQKYLCSFKIFTRLSVGAVLLVLHLLGLTSTEVIGNFGPEIYRVSNFTCNAGDKLPRAHCDSDNDSQYLMIVLSCVHVVGQCLIFTAGLEFVCAQAPSSMKGTVVGFIYFFLGLFIALVDVVFLAFHRTVISASGVVLGCVFWFLVTCTVCTVVLGLVLGVTSRSYKNRERDTVD